MPLLLSFFVSDKKLLPESDCVICLGHVVTKVIIELHSATELGLLLP